MSNPCAVSLPKKNVHGAKSKQKNLINNALSVAVVGVVAHTSPAAAACIQIANAFVCTSTVTETIDAGGENNILFTDGAAGILSFNGEAGNDQATFDNSSSITAVGSATADGGDGDDQITVRGASTVTGNLVGANGDDSILVEGASRLVGNVQADAGADYLAVRGESTVIGDILGGAGNDVAIIYGQSTVTGAIDGEAGDDTVTIQGQSTITGNMLGGSGDDAILIEGESALFGDISGGADNDSIRVRGESSITGSLYGNGGNDNMTVEGNSTVDGALRGGDGDDTITVAGGSVRNGISADDGDDEVNLYSGTIAGFDSGNSLDVGSGNDALNIVFDEDLDISEITVFNGGTGADTLQFSEFDANSTNGGSFGRTFNAWETVTAYNSIFDITAGTITNLNLTGGSVLRQINGTRALRAADAQATDTTTLTVDGTSAIDMQDNPPLQVRTLPPANHSVADDAITVNALDLTGQKNGDTLFVDFDANDTAHQNARDAAKSGNADQIDVSGFITLDGTIGVDIANSGGYFGSGLPFALSGSVAVVNDLQAAALANPGIAANLTSSTTYMTDDLFYDPARIWGLVDQGEGGVYLQWTTPINDMTMAPHAGAGLATAIGAANVLGATISGVTDNSLDAKAVCAAEDKASCAGSAVSVWAQAGGSDLRFGATNTLAGFDSTGRHLSGGVSYQLSPAWNAGLFGALQQTSSDLGSVAGFFGPRASSSETTSAYLGAYAKVDFQSVYIAAISMIGRSTTDLTNGTLLFAQSNYDSTNTAIGATLGSKHALGTSGWSVDPRVELSYSKSQSGTHTDSFGLGINNSTAQRRAAASLGLIYAPESSPLSLTVRGGISHLKSSIETLASDTFTETSASISAIRSDKVFTASVDANWALSDTTLLTGSISTESGKNAEALRGGLNLSFRF